MRPLRCLPASVITLVLLVACTGRDETGSAVPTTGGPTTAEPTEVTRTEPPSTTVVVTTTETTTPPKACGSGFPDLSAAPGAGPGYERPAVTVSCAGGTMTVRSNGMPGYLFVSRTPNGLRAQDYTWTVPATPVVAAAPTPVEGRLGTLGFTVTGIPIFGPMEGPVPPAQAFGDPVYNRLLDDCGGHTGYNADYHHHTIVAAAACGLVEVVVGYALDGFPIHSNPGGVHRSGWTMTGDPRSNAWQAYTFTGGDGTLDRCNGRRGPDGTYRYYVTETFPYLIGCFAGTAPAQSGNAAAPMPPMNGPPPPGDGRGPAVRALSAPGPGPVTTAAAVALSSFCAVPTWPA